MNYLSRLPGGVALNYIRFVLSGYRLLALAIAAIQIFFFTSAHHSLIPLPALFTAVSFYTLFRILHPFRWHQSYSLLGTDIAVCIFLVVSSGGLYSPFLLYSLAPVVTAALLLGGWITSIIVGLSLLYVVAGHLFNPFHHTQWSLLELSYFLIYAIAVCLTAILPYLINANLRQKLRSQVVLKERQRLSREIHDGTAQTMSALCWQIQLLQRRLQGMGIELSEVKQLEELAEKARQDARESLELLRNYTGDGSFLPHLRGYLEHLRQTAGIDFRLDVNTAELILEASVELELLRICQEALTNIRKHSGAKNVQVRVAHVNGHMEVGIADDGCGFDAMAYYQDGSEARGHGLAVMQERAESIGGKFRVLSLPGKGSEIQVEVPLNHNQDRLLWRKR